MPKYELTLVLDLKATPAKKKAVGETIEKIIKMGKGKVEKTEDELIPSAYTVGCEARDAVQ